MTLDCTHARDAILDEQRGRLDADASNELREHLRGCEACSELERQELALSDLLAAKLSQPAAPGALREQLMAAYAPQAKPEVAARSPWTRRSFSAAMGVVALLAAAGVLWIRPSADAPKQVPLGHAAEEVPLGYGELMVREALNDHLRVVYAQNPVEIPSGGIHQVKPWFTGRLDFAPDVSFSGDGDFPLVGGAVGYFIDRKAATFIFKRRLHTISCFVFRAHEMPWPRGNERPLGAGLNAQVTSLDGFHVVMWRSGDLGHALVSDVSEPELIQLAQRIAR